MIWWLLCFNLKSLIRKVTKKLILMLNYLLRSEKILIVLFFFSIMFYAKAAVEQTIKYIIYIHIFIFYRLIYIWYTIKYFGISLRNMSVTLSLIKLLWSAAEFFFTNSSPSVTFIVLIANYSQFSGLKLFSI